MESQPIYLDNAATTRVDPRVAVVAMEAMTEEFGNAGSRTHAYGSRAKASVENARSHVAKALGCSANEIFFTSGATESNNLAILGFASPQYANGPKHIISTSIEHKAVLEPLEYLSSIGYEVTLISPDERGWICADQVKEALRPDTGLVSVMHVNNETGVIQPIDEIARALTEHPALFHVDGSQGFCKANSLGHIKRIDMISISGHKIFAPKGIGALMLRSRAGKLPISQIMYGGAQERGIRPGTLPVHLIAALGEASIRGTDEFEERIVAHSRFRRELLDGLAPLKFRCIGDQSRCAPNIISLSFDGIDSEAFILATKDIIAISNGSACTSHRYEPSHVLTAMGLDETTKSSTVRLSWSHDTVQPDWREVVSRISPLA